MTESTKEQSSDTRRRHQWLSHPFLEMLQWDIRLQTRYGIIPVYAVLTLVFVVGLQLTNPTIRPEVVVLLIALEPAVLGFYFIAVLVLYEKTEGVLEALVVSPLGDTGYLFSKTVSLSLLAVSASIVVVSTSLGVTFRTPILLVGVLLSASLFVLLGFVSVSRFDSINEYFVSAALWGAVLFSPILGYIGLFDTVVFYLIPIRPLLITIEAGLQAVPSWKVIYAGSYLLVGNVVAFRWARRLFSRNIVRQGTPGRKLGHVSGDAQRRDIWNHTLRPPWLELLITDVKNWVRDPMLVFAAVGPLILAAIIRVAAPVITTMVNGVVDLTTYYPIIEGTMAVFGPGLFGFVVGMFILEDRDEGVLTAYRTTPLSLRGYLLYRGSTAYLFSFVSTLPTLVVMGLVSPSVPVLIGTTIVGALSGPVIGLGLGLTASNSIEGVALAKFSNPILLGPALLIALVPVPLQFFVGIVPTYWPIKTYVVGVTGVFAWPVYFIVGIIIHILVIIGIFQLLVPRVFEG